MNALKVAWIVGVLLALVAIAHAQDSKTKSGTQEAAEPAEITLEPQRPVTGDRLKLTVKVRDSFIRAEVKWTLNGEDVKNDICTNINEVSELDRDVKAGDRIEVAVSLYDSARGTDLKGVVKKLKIRNSGPILILGEQNIDDYLYTAEIKAYDPDGDNFTLTLKEGPSGMTLESDGKIYWKFDKNTKGRFKVKVSGKDDKGTENILAFSFAILRNLGTGR
jgi:hypothetical protein